MVSLEEIRSYCLLKREVSEDLPFDDTTLVFRVYGKIFLLTNIESAASINLKCEPSLAIELREKYPEITPGYHMNKRHWNTLSLGGGLNTKLIFELIDHSYNMVVKTLPKSVQHALSV